MAKELADDVEQLQQRKKQLVEVVRKLLAFNEMLIKDIVNACAPIINDQESEIYVAHASSKIFFNHNISRSIGIHCV